MKTKTRKGQSATEYLMTYGWAIFAIVVVAGILWNIGLFGERPEVVSEPVYLQLNTDEWEVVCRNQTIRDIYDSTIDNDIAEYCSGCYDCCGMEYICNYQDDDKYTCHTEGDWDCYRKCMDNADSYLASKQNNETVCTEWMLVKR